jgi:hypothetical protein
MGKRHLVFGLGPSVLLLAFAASNAVAEEVCVRGAGIVIYKLQVGTAGEALVRNGIRIGAAQTPIVGTQFTDSGGTIIIGFTELFDWGSGQWVDPAGVTVLKFSSGGTVTFDTTYYGASFPPRAFTGTAVIVPCPTGPAASPTAVGNDPNAKSVTSSQTPTVH